VLEDEIPESILVSHPELRRVQDALRAYREGRPISVTCEVCGKPLEVIDVPESGALIVACATGCTYLRVKREPSKPDNNDEDKRI